MVCLRPKQNLNLYSPRVTQLSGADGHWILASSSVQKVQDDCSGRDLYIE